MTQKSSFASFQLRLKDKSLNSKNYLDFLDHLKAAIPATQRVFYPGSRKWNIGNRYANTFIELAKQFGLEFFELFTEATELRSEADPSTASSAKESQPLPDTRASEFNVCLCVFDNKRQIIAIKRLYGHSNLEGVRVMFELLLQKIYKQSSLRVVIDAAGKWFKKGA